MNSFHNPWRVWYGKDDFMRPLVLIVFTTLLLFLHVMPAAAADIPFGVHILDPGEIDLVLPYRGNGAKFYLTVPLSMYDRRQEVWEHFFETAYKAGMTPIVRWVTTFENGSWGIPSRKDVVEATQFITSVNWPGQRIMVLWNEPNHAKEWGGRVDPDGYVEMADFAALWLKTDSHGFTILPAGLDGAAPNGRETMDSFVFIEKMFRAKPDFFTNIDGWTSHSYPNPDFSASPYRSGKNSLRGYQLELTKLKAMTGKEYPIYITETGWKVNKAISRTLPSYYRYAMNNVWNNPSIQAVTFFLLRGFDGPFEGFSLLTPTAQPTPQMSALMAALDIVPSKE